MGYWKELPYRGEPEPHFKKPRKQVRDVKKEKREFIVTPPAVFVILRLTIGPLGITTITDPSINIADKVGRGIIMLILISTLTVGIAKGITSINKFRKGYDVDISEEEPAEHPHNARIEEHHDLPCGD